MEKQISFIQIDKDDAAHFEVASQLWLPFIREVNEHDGMHQSEEQITDGLKKRISIQGCRKDMHFEIAFMNEEPFGIAMFAIDLGTVYGLLEKGYGTIMGFYIHPKFRRRGLGTAFSKHIEAILYADGARKMYICPDSVTGEPFWRANGYSDSGKMDPDDKKPIYVKEIPGRSEEKMSNRTKIINSFYADGTREDARLFHSRHGQLEYLTTMRYIHRFVPETACILEVGAGTGRYSVALAKEGHSVTAVELAAKNFEMLLQNSRGIDTMRALQGDALDLSEFEDGTFDCTLVLGPLYHLYDRADQLTALNEAIRVTKDGGLIMVAFLSVHAIMFDNYLRGNWRVGEKENFTENYQVKHFEEQLFTGFNIDEFESLFDGLAVEKMTTAATDGILELAEGRRDFEMSDDEFQDYAKYHLHHCERRELLGCSSHLLYICKKCATENR